MYDNAYDDLLLEVTGLNKMLDVRARQIKELQAELETFRELAQLRYRQLEHQSAEISRLTEELEEYKDVGYIKGTLKST